MTRAVYCGLALIFLIIGISGQDEPTFLSTSTTKQGTIGQTIVFECSVDNLRTYSIEWWYLNQHLQISLNQGVLVNDSHYSILQPLGSHGDMNHLQISPVRGSDAGHYQCKITGTTVVQTHTLYVTDAPVVTRPPPHTLPPVNFTDCCLSQHVNPLCLPICSPSTVDLNTFEASWCAADLTKLVQCGSDNRNHVPCCRQLFVPDMCLGFCVNDMPDPPQPACLRYTKQITACYVEGQYILPTEPFLFDVEAESASTIHTSWQPPVENGGSVIGYRLFYKRTIDTAFQSTLMLDAGQLEYTLTGLEADSLYTLYVISINNHGASQPSPRLRAATHPRNPLPPGLNRVTFEQCCVYRGVSERCQPVLCGEGPVQSNVSMIDCFPEVNKVFQCMSGERNHTACCEEQDIPPECYSLCSGHVTNLQLHQLKCISRLPQISSCFNDGAKYLPGAPHHLVVQSLTLNTAVIQWKPPLENAALVQQYKIRYWISQTSYVLEETVSGQVNRATVSGLVPSTQYDMEVLAVGRNGSSIPSPSVIVITHGISIPPEKPEPMPPVNETACCIESGVQHECLSLCDYQANYDEVQYPLLVRCQPDLGKMFMCGSDGRNHTGCCQERMVPSQCLMFCAFTQEMAANMSLSHRELNSCIINLEDITMCMQEGLVSLPSPPQDVIVQSTTQTITVQWKAPSHIPTEATLTYHILWKPVLAVNFSEAVSQVLSYTIHNLPTDTEYTVQVTASNSEGYSLPAPLVLARTKPEVLPLNVTLPADMTSCCYAKGVSDKCLSACSGNSVVDLHECSRDLLKVLECAADGRDHVPCCTRSDLPSQCLSHCRGQPRADSFLHLLCMTFVPQILTCFRQGYKDLPSPPVNFHAAETGPRFARFAWDPPEQNAEDVHYQLYYIGAYDTQDPLTEMDVSSPYQLQNLQPSIPYTVYVVAYNEHGTSLPTPKVLFVTRANESPVITITQNPPDRYVKEGHMVVLTCHASGQPMPTIKWIRNGMDLNTEELRLGPLTPEHTGRYTCVAQNGRQPVTENVILNVQYAPVVTPAEPIVYVPPSQYKIAQLQCNVRGFPDTVTWMKDGVPITESHPDFQRFMWRREVQEDEGIIEAHFDIASVHKTDYGIYTCKANNTFGIHDATIKLVDPTSGTLPPGLETGAAIVNITSCCMVNGVRDSCLHICSFDINLYALMEMMPEQQGECLQDGDKILSCAADGRNHTSCCMKEHMPEQCLPFCMGVVPDPLWKNQSSCVLYMEEIIDCMEEGHAVLPSPPRHLRGRLIDGFIEVWWDTPGTNPDKVNNYDIIYYNGDMSEFQNISLSNNVTVYNLTGVHSFSEYTIQVEARNHYGTSIKSNRIAIKTYEMFPTPPRDLNIVSLNDGRVLLHWMIPLEYPGAVFSYNVYYALSNKHPDYQKVNTYTSNIVYTLEGLEGATNYSIYVTAVSSHYETKRSNIVQVVTEAFVNMPGKPKASVIIPVISVLVVLAIIVAVAVFIYWYFRIRRVSHQRFKDAVSFENPGYASRGPANGSTGEPREARAWISGLPSEAVMTTTGDSADYQPHNGLVESRPGVTDAKSFEKNPRINGSGVKGGGSDIHTGVPKNGGSDLLKQGDTINSSIMKEMDSNSDQGYATLSHSTHSSNGAAGSPENHSYATLKIAPPQPADSDNVHLDLEPLSSEL